MNESARKRFVHAGVTYEFSSRMTFAEGRAVEKFTGHVIGELAEPKVRGSSVVLQAMMWVAMKRVTPELKFTDLDDMSIDDFTFLEDDPQDTPTDPTDAAGPPPLTPSDSGT